jgi:DHHA1 domain
MTHSYVFNGDADGLCALQQLRLSGPRGAAAGAAREPLVTGVKRDIALLERVAASAGDACTVLDVSLDVNRAALDALLAAGVSVRYFDHHFAGEIIPTHPGLDAHIDLSPNVCTSLLVDRYLEGRFRSWAIVGAFGDSLAAEARALAEAAGFSPEAGQRLQRLGVAINYNAYGEAIADLHVPPAELAEEMLRYPDPLQFAAESTTFRRLATGFDDDMERARQLEPVRRTPGALVFVLPDAAWARRASGTLANDLARAHAASAIAIVSPRTEGGYLVSVRVPRDCPVSAEAFCRRFPTGGGRRTAAGINHLPGEALESFASAFEQQFLAETTT